MHNMNSIEENIDKEINSFNIIVADQDLETFEVLYKIKRNFNFINLSSDFAVNFILEYEKIDIIVLSRKISNLDNIIRKAARKKIRIFIIGKDIKYPINEKELESVLIGEIKNRIERKRERRKLDIRKCLAGFFRPERGIASTSEKFNSPLELYPNLNRNRDCSDELIDECQDKINDDVCKKSSNNFKNEKKINDEDRKVNLKSQVKLESQDDFDGKIIKTIKQKIIIFTKAKGGVGSTLLCIFLGFVFRKMKTLIVDLNFSEGGGDVSYYLDIPKSPSIINFMEGYDRNSMENSIVSLKDNLDILQSPPTYELSKKIELQDIYSLVDIARKKYHLIIFDLPNQISELWLGVIDMADLLVMVSDYTLGSIGRLVSINDRFIYDDMEKILVINRYNKKNGLNITRNQLEQFFGLSKFVYLNESELLRGRTEFSRFDFSTLKSFDGLASKVLDLLTCG